MVFSEGIELYIAENVQEPGDVPSNVYRITSDFTFAEHEYGYFGDVRDAAHRRLFIWLN